MAKMCALDGFLTGVIIFVCFFVLGEGQENVIRFNRGEINEIIDTHNNLRRSIYNAANMRELSWNEGLAMASSEWGSNCNYTSRPDNQMGQNMHYFYGADNNRSPAQLFRLSFNAWTDETQHYDYRKFRSCGRKNVCSYVQLIAADVMQVGCSIVKCPSLKFEEPRGTQKDAKFLVCFYSPWVDILNKEVFIPERRCGACPSGTRCIDNLCSARLGEVRLVPSIGSPKVDISITSSGRNTEDTKSHHSVDSQIPVTNVDNRRDQEDRRRHKERKQRTRLHGNRRNENSVYLEHRMNTVSELRARSSSSNNNNNNNNSHVVYRNNNRVMPFPGRAERRDIRKIEKAERYLESHDPEPRQAELVPAPETVLTNATNTNDTGDGKSRKKRQLSYEDAIYYRRLEYERYLQEYRRHMRQREEARRQYEEELKRRNSHAYRMQELRRLDEHQRYEEERRRRQRLREQRRRLEALALVQSQGELTGEEQFFTISAHNLLRREVGARDLAWSSYLERWAKYVIRCDTEYPGPITCYTNFGKSNQGDDIYNVVYQWGSEGYDFNRPLTYGCRTPYDKSLCNHNTIVRDKSLTQMACAAMNCGLQRQLTCIYNKS